MNNFSFSQRDANREAAMQNASSIAPSVGLGPMLVTAIGGGLLIWSSTSLNVGLALAVGLLALAAGASYWERRGIRVAFDLVLTQQATLEWLGQAN